MLGPHGDGLQGFEGKVQGVCGGVPSYSGRQKQTAFLPTRRHPELGPHGLGLQLSPSGTVKVNMRSNKSRRNRISRTYCNF